MKVATILYDHLFIKEFQALSIIIQHKAVQTEQRFRDNPLHPSLRLHRLKGKLEGSWSISVTISIRIIFKRADNGDILFYSIGHHDIYRSL